MKKIFKKLLIIAGAMAGFVVLVLFLSILLIQTGPGQRLLERNLNNLLEWDGGRVSITGISGMIPFNFRVEQVAVEDAQGVWLNIDEIELHWSFSRLLSRELHIFQAGSGSVELARLPQTQPREKDEKPAEPLELKWKWPLPPLTIEHLFLDRVWISDQILDENVALSARASLFADSMGFSLADLKVDRVDKPYSLVSLNAELSRGHYFLDLDIRISDPGMLKSLVGLENWPESSSLEIQGAGPLASWQGALNLSGNDMFNADLDLSIRERENFFLLSMGSIYVSPLLIPEQGLGFTEEPFDIFLDIGLDSDYRVLLEKLSIKSGKLALDSKAQFDLDQMDVSGNAELVFFDLNSLVAGTDLNFDQPLQVELDVSGPVNNLSGSVGATLGGMTGYGLGLENASFSADFNLNFVSSFMASSKGGLNLDGFIIEQYANLPRDFSLVFDLDYTPENTLMVKSAELKGGGIVTDLKGQLDFSSMDFSADISTFAREVEKLIPGFGEDPLFHTDLQLKAEASGNISKNQYLTSLNLGLPGFDSREQIIAAAVGQDFILESEIGFDDQMNIDLSRVMVKGAAFSVQAAGRTGLESRDLSLSGNIDFPSLSMFSDPLEHEISGSFNLDFSVLGTIDQPGLEAIARIQDLDLDPVERMNMDAHLHLSLLDGIPSGAVDVHLAHDGENLDFFTDFQAAENKIEIQRVMARGPGMNMSGSLEVDLADTLARGELLIDFFDLASLGDFFGLGLDGSLNSRLTLRPRGIEQDVDFIFNGDDLLFEDFFIDRVHAAGTARNLLSDPEFDAEIEIDSLVNPQVRVINLWARAYGGPQKINFYKMVTGNAFHDFEVSLKGDYSRVEDAHQLKIAELKGSFAHDSFALLDPVQLTHSDESTTLSPLEMDFASGRLSAGAELTKEQINARMNVSGLNASDIPVAALEHVLGQVNIDIIFTGTRQAPQLKAEAAVERLAPADPSLEIPFPLTFTSILSLDSTGAELEASILERQTRLARVDFFIPLEFSLDPVIFSVSDPLPLSGSFVSSLDLETIALTFLPPDNILTGILNADLKISGTSLEPSLDGLLEITEASYENLEAGLLIADLKIEAQASGTVLEIVSISATDGIRGIIRGGGLLDFDPSGSMPWDFELGISNARILNHRFAEVRVSSADFYASGDSSGGEVTGKVRFDRILASLPDASPAGVVDLEVTEINLPHEDRVEVRRETAGKYPLALDLEFVFPARVFVRGRGLESEWQGNIMIQGEAASPSVRGNLQVVRGRLQLLDRRFYLVPESYINLDGSFPPDPGVDINAYMQQKDRRINVRVFGPALEPDIVLTSEPPMPQDEILAWVLFGRDASALTPFQAVALVDAARTLAMGSSGPGVMDRIRSITGIDDIEISRDEHGHTQFGLGKYVHERVYVEVKKGTVPGSDSVSVEIELTPRISLESNVDSDSEGGVGIFWRLDY